MEYKTSNGVTSLVDVQGVCPQLYSLVLVAASAATVSGFFVNELGLQISNALTGSVTTTPQLLQTVLGLSSLPAGAAGFVGISTGTINYGFGGALNSLFVPAIPAGITTDMTTNSARYPSIAATTRLKLGRVN